MYYQYNDYYLFMLGSLGLTPDLTLQNIQGGGCGLIMRQGRSASKASSKTLDLTLQNPYPICIYIYIYICIYVHTHICINTIIIIGSITV